MNALNNMKVGTRVFGTVMILLALLMTVAIVSYTKITAIGFEIEELAQDTRVIRNRRKLEAVVYNAQQILALDEAYGSFQQYLRSQGDFDATLARIKKDFKFMGPTGVYYLLYVVGEEVPPHEEFEARYRK